MAATRSASGAPPKRKLRVMFLGAGASKAAGLPLTEELLQHIWPRDHETVEQWAEIRSRTAWAKDLQRAVTVLYPDGASRGFRPPVSEFFTLLEVVDRVHSGRERLPLSAGDLLRDLRCEIARGLTVSTDRLRRGMAGTPHHRWIARDRPHVVITSNWDTLVEQAALRAGVAVSLGWPRNGRGGRQATLTDKDPLVVLKLHGSTDWGFVTDQSYVDRDKDWKYERLDTVIRPGTQTRKTSINGSEEVVRFRGLDAPIAADRTALGIRAPLMATMAAGKDEFIRPIAAVWDDAYWSLSRAVHLSVVGYSFPPDDLELRTLLRLTSRRPGAAELAPGLELSVCNPSPDTHDRARSLLGAGLAVSYEGAGRWTPW